MCAENFIIMFSSHFEIYHRCFNLQWCNCSVEKPELILPLIVLLSLFELHYILAHPCSSQSLVTTVQFSFCIRWTFWFPQMREKMCYLFFCVRLISFDMMIYRSIHVDLNDRITFFLWPNSILFCIYAFSSYNPIVMGI